MLQEKRSSYNRQIINLNDFVFEFYKYTTFILKKIASSHGNLYCLDKSREEVNQAIEDGFGEESYVKAIWIRYGQALSRLYEVYPYWKDATIFNEICELIVEYYNQYEIFISETPQGIYYDIPVRL